MNIAKYDDNKTTTPLKIKGWNLQKSPKEEKVHGTLQSFDVSVSQDPYWDVDGT